MGTDDGLKFSSASNFGRQGAWPHFYDDSEDDLVAGDGDTLGGPHPQ